MLPISASSAWMRAVTLDCTVFSSTAARFMPPSRATASNTLQVRGVHLRASLGYRKNRSMLSDQIASRNCPNVIHRAGHVEPNRHHSPRTDAFPTALGGLIALAAAIGIGRFVYTPILPAMIEALGLGKSAAGLIASANFLGYLAGRLAGRVAKLSADRAAAG